MLFLTPRRHSDLSFYVIAAMQLPSTLCSHDDACALCRTLGRHNYIAAHTYKDLAWMTFFLAWRRSPDAPAQPCSRGARRPVDRRRRGAEIATAASVMAAVAWGARGLTRGTREMWLTRDWHLGACPVSPGKGRFDSKSGHLGHVRDFVSMF